MFFSKRNKGDSAAPEQAETPTNAPPSDSSTSAASANGDFPIPADRASDLVAEILRTYGQGAFATSDRTVEEISEEFEAWARHLLLGIAPPGREHDSETEADSGSRRDLPALRRAFQQHRRAEGDYVRQSLGDFREAAWAFMGGLRTSLDADHAADRRVNHRIRRLESAVRKGDPALIKSEALETASQITELLGERQVRERDKLAAMAARLDGLRDELDNVRAQAAIDSLTELFNREAFDEQIERELDLATIFGRNACLLLIDIDHFKWVNDTHGHRAGDEVLRRFAKTLSRCFARRGDFLARYGGEEFVVVLREVDAATACNVAERAMMAIRNMEVEIETAEEPLRVTASIGVAAHRRGEEAGAWIERTDRALYRAKDAGRDRIEADTTDFETAQAESRD